MLCNWPRSVTGRIYLPPFTIYIYLYHLYLTFTHTVYIYYECKIYEAMCTYGTQCNSCPIEDAVRWQGLNMRPIDWQCSKLPLECMGLRFCHSQWSCHGALWYCDPCPKKDQGPITPAHQYNSPITYQAQGIFVGCSRGSLKQKLQLITLARNMKRGL